jgi:hypothetical protein
LGWFLLPSTIAASTSSTGPRSRRRSVRA